MLNMKRSMRFQMESGDFPVPVLYLKFGENAGIEAKDSSPEGNDGTIEGASWVNGVIGPGLGFDGDNDYVEIDDADELDGFTEGASWEFWMKSEDITKMENGSWRWMISKYLTTENQRVWAAALYRVEGETRLRLMISDNGTTFGFWSKTIDWEDDELHHIVWVWKPGEHPNLYIDGELQTLDALSTPRDTVYAGTASVLLGKCGYNPAGRWFEGLLDELLVYDVALTSQQVLKHYYGIE